jgi:RNA polymerase sigma factor (sigma-70 family)
MQRSTICEDCTKRNFCHQICKPMERFLKKGTRYQKERTVPSEALDHFAFEAGETGLLNPSGNGHSSVSAHDPFLRKAQEAIKNLTPKQERIYCLYYVEGWTNGRIAEEIGTSRQNVAKIGQRIKEKVAKFCSM